MSKKYKKLGERVEKMKADEIKKKNLNEEGVQKENANGGVVEELDLDSLAEVTGGSLRNNYKTPTQDISGDTKAKI